MKTAGETAKETRSAGGRAGGTAEETAVALRSKTSGSLRSSSPGIPPCTPSFPSSLHSSFSGKDKTHKHKQICGIVPGLGGWQKFVYVLFWVIPYGGEETHKQNPSKIPRQSRENFVFFLFSFCVLFVSILGNSGSGALWMAGGMANLRTIVKPL